MNHSVSKDLTQVRALIEKGWHQCGMARDSDGRSVDVQSVHAVSFCLLGAVERVAYYPRKRLVDLWDALNAELSTDHTMYTNAFGNLMTYNDSTRRVKEDILKLIDKAIAKAKT